MQKILNTKVQKNIKEILCFILKDQVEDDILPIKYILSLTLMRNENATKHSDFVLH